MLYFLSEFFLKKKNTCKHKWPSCDTVEDELDTGGRPGQMDKLADYWSSGEWKNLEKERRGRDETFGISRCFSI